MTEAIIKNGHIIESEMLKNALNGDIEAANRSLKYLSSTNPHLCTIMQTAIHELKDANIWPKLLTCLALHQWDEKLDCERRSDPSASIRIDQAIIEVFVEDKNGWEKNAKEKVLHEAITDPTPRVRFAGAYLLGLRGDHQAIPILAEAVQSRYQEWKSRAAKALANIKHEQCGPPLLQLLIENKGDLHREASRALHSLGPLAKSAWQDALDHPDSHIRWHAARALGEMGDTSMATLLAEGLRDDDYVVRWATADVLARLGAEGVTATLTMLTRYPITEQFRQAAYHALHGNVSSEVQKRLKPLLDSMRGVAASIESAIIAQDLLLNWEKGNNGN